jgi:hypothetical protein
VIRAVAALALAMFPLTAAAQCGQPHMAGGPVTACTSPASVALSGQVAHPTKLTVGQLKKLPPVNVSVSRQTDRGPMTARFTGALVWTILDSAGWINGPEKNAYLRHTIFVTGKDGYIVALSEGEIDPKLEGKQIILAAEKDGQPLDAPRLVVPGDAHASRSVHDVVSIEVH